jgi:hypothetical protein
LANIWSSSSGSFDQHLLRDLPNGLVDIFVFLWKVWNLLYGTLVSNKSISSLGIPHVQIDQILYEMRVNADKLSGKNSSGVDICGIWLETFIVSHDLSSGSCRHWCHKKRVSSSMLHNFFSKTIPVIPISSWLLIPKIELEFAFTKRRAFK